LTGIPDVGHAERTALLCVLEHRSGVVRRHNREPAVLDRAERQLAGIGHRTGVERRNLIALDVGAAEERGRELSWNLADEGRIHPRGLEPPAILVEILSRRGHQTRLLAEQRQRVGDVRCASTAALVHRVHEKAEADPRHVLGQEVFGELPRKRHEVVESDRAGDDDVHAW
jgi:hypothetical protein